MVEIVATKPILNMPVRVSIERYPTKELFTLNSVDASHQITPGDLERIAEVCNEERIYNTFFKKRFEDRPYGAADAGFFINIAREGWQKQEWFIFLLRDHRKRIVGLLDLMSNDLSAPAQIGYWVSENTPGVMTNALLALSDLAKEAGFTSLYGTPRPTNERSKNLLLRAGFTPAGLVDVKGEQFLKMTKELT